MIIDNIKNSYKYLTVHKAFEEAFCFIVKSKNEKLPAGHYGINGEEIFANIEEYGTVDSSLLRFEMHKNYIDIHYILEGEEAISYDINDTDFQTDVSDNDCYFFTDRPENFITLNSDTYAIFLPFEKHMPKCSPNGFSACVKKVIVKIRI